MECGVNSARDLESQSEFGAVLLALQAAGMAAHQRIAEDFGMAALADRLEGLISAAASRQSAAPS